MKDSKMGLKNTRKRPYPVFAKKSIKVKRKKEHRQERPTGFDRGLQPSKILGASDISGKLMFLMKWHGCDQPDVVPAAVANVRCPQLVIKFYVERLSWYSDQTDEGIGDSESDQSSEGSGDSESE
uniref:Umbrea n=1 Tax=Drosophila mimetica TaxID=30038 RepID=R9QZE5_9MUSC|nr:Umbrea [Drosophila mimetica]